MDVSNAFGHVFFGLFPNFKPTDVFISGKQVVRKGEFVSKKLKSEFALATKSSAELWKRVKE